jgi:hypothetical protein
MLQSARDQVNQTRSERRSDEGDQTAGSRLKEAAMTDKLERDQARTRVAREKSRKVKRCAMAFG